MSAPRVLIAYDSRAGGNYVEGEIVDLQVGNTEAAARTIRKLSGGDLFKIDTVRPYPTDYHQATDVAKEELRQNSRPELSSHVDNMNAYGAIYPDRHLSAAARRDAGIDASVHERLAKPITVAASVGNVRDVGRRRVAPAQAFFMTKTIPEATRRS